MTERRYGDEEVREIFSLATTGDTRDRSLPAESGGLTLDELQRIGQEAGIEPARVAQAAEKLDARGRPAPVRRSFGLPIGLSRVVDLPRAPTDREWEQLISQFRTTFGTQGHTTTSGGLREWSQGNLHISVEPTEHGEQLRLSTLNERRHGPQRARDRDGRDVGAHGCSGRRRRQAGEGAGGPRHVRRNGAGRVRSQPGSACRGGLASASDRWRRLPSMR